MSKMAELSTLLESLVECGNKLVQTAQGLQKFYSAADEPPKTRKKEKKEDPVQEESPKLDMITVREQLAKKADEDGGRYKVQVKDLVKKYANGGTLKDIPPESFSDLMKELEVIGNG